MSSSNTMIYGFSIITAAVLGFAAMYAAEKIYPLSGGGVSPAPTAPTAPTAPAPTAPTAPPAPAPPAPAPAPAPAAPAPTAPAPATAAAPNLSPLNVGQDFAGGAHVNGLQHSGGFTFPTQLINSKHFSS